MENRAFNMDCMEAMRSMPDQCFDLAVVDPPYGIKISNNMGRRKGERPSEYKKVTWDDAPPPPEYFTELVRVSKNQIIFGANHFVSLIPAADSNWPGPVLTDRASAWRYPPPRPEGYTQRKSRWRCMPGFFNTMQSKGTGSWIPTWGAGQAGSPRGTPGWTLSGMRSTRNISRHKKSGSSSTPRNCPCSAGGGI